MKITDLEIDGFGVWRDLKLTDLSPRVTAFYGPNEAGKTTVMHFIRGVMYGMSPFRRKRYLPPLDGGQPGGTLGIAEADFRFRACRIADRGPDDVGRVICTTADGTTGGDRLLREALVDVDEPTFTNVFAIGLDEVHELGMLSGSKAAEWLYRLTSGLDRISLYDVIKGLRSNRRELLSDDGEPGRIFSLTTQRDKLRAEVDQLREQNRLWSQLAVKIKELDEQITAAEADVRQAARRARTVEIAVGLKPNWRKREKLVEDLARLSGRVRLPDDAIDRLNSLNSDLEKHQREADVLAGQRRQLREEAERLGINELLVCNASRIDALGEQRDWLLALSRQRDDFERDAKQYEARLAAEQKRLADALGLKEGQRLKEISENDLEGLQPQMDALRMAQKRLEAAQRDLDMLTESERSLKTQIETAIIGGESHRLPMDLGEASDLVARLRKRLQVEQRLDQARRHEIELEQQSHDLLDDQVMPMWLFGWLLATFVLGTLMLGIWALVPDSPFGKYGGLIAMIGVGGAAFAWVFKYFADDAAAEKLDACQRQMEVVVKQIADAERDKAGVDAELPMTDGSVVLRLQAAERHLAELENVLPVEAQRKQAGSEVANAEARVKQAQRERDAVVTQWRATVIALGLPESLDAQKLASVTDRYGQLAELESRARHRREDAAARQREHDALLRRISELALEVGCVLKSKPAPVSRDARPPQDHAERAGAQAQGQSQTPDAVDQLDHLLAERRRQLGDVERRIQLREKAKELKNEEGKHLHAVAALKRRRAAIFQSAACEDEQQYRMVAADQHQAALMANQRDAVSREITAAIGKHEPEEVFAQLLSPDSIGQLEKMWEQATGELDARQARLKELAQHRGELCREQAVLAKDRSLAEKQLELTMVERQLADARHSWRVHATACRVFERIRHDYETHRQPETLGEASRYLAKLTGDRYRRIWTPLAEDVLIVDTADGQSLPVDVLSRGTREQLFLSVRLALVAMFARRGVNLPMVLDDVLVNFDVGRAQRAAEVLCDFASAGHQLLFFTCHEHIWTMFKELNGDCRRLPARRGAPEPVRPAPPPVVIEASQPKKGVPRRVRKPTVVSAPSTPWFDYPFVERVVEETIATPVETLIEQPATFEEYSFEPQAVAYVFSDATRRELPRR